MNKVYSGLLSMLVLGNGLHANSTTIYQYYGCNGENIECNLQVNAVGDLVSWDVSNARMMRLGSISKPRSIQLVFPSKGNKLIYSFTPANVPANIKGKLVRVLFVTFDLERITETGKLEKELLHVKKLEPNAKIALKVYRQIGEQPQWVEVATIPCECNQPGDLGKVPVTLTPEGTAEFILKKNNSDEKHEQIINLMEMY